MTVLHPSRPVRLAAAAAIAGLALGGCSMFSPQTTTNVTYAPSDGVQGDVGEVGVRNLMVLTAEQGAQAELVGALFNGSAESVSLEVVVREPSDDPANPSDPLVSETIDLEPNESISIGPEADEQVTVERLDIVPRRVAEVSLIGAGGNLTLRVPVLDGTLREYADLVDQEG